MFPDGFHAPSIPIAGGLFFCPILLHIYFVKDPIVQIGEPVLRAKALPVAQADFGSPKLQKLLARMKELLAREEYGVALAAPQVGEALRLFIVSGKVFEEPESGDEKEKKIPPDRVFINPEITKRSRTKEEMAEGCLSVRGKYGSVVRHQKVTLKAQDEAGRPFTTGASGLVAQIFQHECDHLEGTLYIDKAASLEDEERHSFKGEKEKGHA